MACEVCLSFALRLCESVNKWPISRVAELVIWFVRAELDVCGSGSSGDNGCVTPGEGGELLEPRYAATPAAN